MPKKRETFDTKQKTVQLKGRVMELERKEEDLRVGLERAHSEIDGLKEKMGKIVELIKEAEWSRIKGDVCKHVTKFAGGDMCKYNAPIIERFIAPIIEERPCHPDQCPLVNVEGEL